MGKRKKEPRILGNGEKFHGGVIRFKSRVSRDGVEAGRWEWRTSERGSRVSYGAKTIAALKKKVFAAIVRSGGTHGRGHVPTLAEYLRLSIARDSESGAWRDDTGGAYLRYVKRVEERTYTDGEVEKSYGSIPLDALEPSDFERLFADMASAKIGSSSRARVFTFVKATLQRAVDQRIISFHPMSGVRTPKHVAAKQFSYTAAQIGKLAAMVDAHVLRALFVLVIHLGLRRGEVCGLQWDDIDFERRVLTIRRQITESGRIDTPKTRAGERDVSLNETCVAALEWRWKIAQEEAAARIARRDAPMKSLARHRRNNRAEASPKKGRPTAEEMPGMVPWMFAGRDGAKPNPRNILQRVYKPMIEACGMLPPDVVTYDRRGNEIERKAARFGLHDLRRTFATLAVGTGIANTTVRDILGHTTTAMTDRYVKHNPQAIRSATDVFGKMADLATAAALKAAPIKANVVPHGSDQKGAVPKSPGDRRKFASRPKKQKPAET